jgi:hypothetical protein
MCFSRATLVAAGGFLEGSGMAMGHVSGRVGEDVELSRKIIDAGGHLFFLPKMKVYHMVDADRLSYHFILERSIRVGYDRAIMTDFRSVASGNAIEPKMLISLFRNSLLILSSDHRLSFRERKKVINTVFVAVLGLVIGYVSSKLEAACR